MGLYSTISIAIPVITTAIIDKISKCIGSNAIAIGICHKLNLLTLLIYFLSSLSRLPHAVLLGV